MPKYRVVSELDAAAVSRQSRGVELRSDQKRLVTIVEGLNLAEAALYAEGSITGKEHHLDRRIVSIEEIHPGLSYADDEIGQALGTAMASPTGEQLVDPMGSTGDADDPELVKDVVYGLRESGLVPGLNISVLDNEMDEPYAMIEVYDEALGIYRSIGTEVRKIAQNRTVEPGWPAIISIAQGLIALSNDLH